MKFLVTIERDEEGFFVVECPALPGCVSQGQTAQETLANIQDAIRGCLEARSATRKRKREPESGPNLFSPSYEEQSTKIREQLS